MNRNLILSTFAVVVFAFGCKRKEVAPDSALNTNSGAGADSVSSNPMNFDASGSDSGKIEGLSTVHFDFDKSNLTADTKSKLSKNAEWIKSHPNVKVQVEGHCDQRGSIEYNLGLGERRANAVKTYLVGIGVPAEKLSTISYGKERPLAKGETDSDMAQNRRANFVPVQ